MCLASHSPPLPIISTQGLPVPKILPRVVVELSREDMIAMVSEPQGSLDAIIAEVERHGHDGIVSAEGGGGREVWPF